LSKRVPDYYSVNSPSVVEWESANLSLFLAWHVRNIELDRNSRLARVSTIMAEKDDKWPENATGKFYVDEQCIDCDLCRETAPDFFTRDEDGGYSYVHKQPDDQEGIDQCMEALEGCPVEAIGEDGDG
jgi:ferredoxin